MVDFQRVAAYQLSGIVWYRRHLDHAVSYQIILACHDFAWVKVPPCNCSIYCVISYTHIVFPSAHFARYFTRNPNYEKGGPEFVFNWSQLKTLQKSFLDSIVVELCLPNSRFPDNILYLLLRDAIDEANKKEQGVFPQVLWDAVDDLSVSLHSHGLS